jgi:hypothetical protein
VAAAIAAVIVAVTLVADRPVPDAGPLLIPGIPLLVVGQLWAIAIISARRPRSARGFRERLAAQWRGQLSSRTVFFPDLPAPAAHAIGAIFVLAGIAAFTAISSLGQGGPSAALPRCPWPLDSHGVITCVTHAAYLRAGAASERGFAGVLLAFFVIHFGVAESELIRRQKNGPSGSTGP